MRLTAQEVFNKLISDDRILELQGQIKFYLGDVNIVVKQRDVVGNIMQEWLQGWLDANDIEYAPSENTQMPPDFFLNPDDKTVNLLEVKAFNRNSSPGFDIADFRMYQSEIIEKPYMLNVEYLIFGYDMSSDGIVTIKDVWLKKVWEITRRMEDWPINLQIKEGHVHKIRPGVWYSDNITRTDYAIFNSLEDFISAVNDTVYQNTETRAHANTWLVKFLRNYQLQYGIDLNIPRWYDIKNTYDFKTIRKREKAEFDLNKAQTSYDKQVEKISDAQAKYDAAVARGVSTAILKAEAALNKATAKLEECSAKAQAKRDVLESL